MKQYVEDLVSLAMETESEDPIDWGDLNIDEESAYRLITLNVLEMYERWEKTEKSELIMLATIVKLIVENFTLNLKLQGKK
jgi:hypothetical protein